MACSIAKPSAIRGLPEDVSSGVVDGGSVARLSGASVRLETPEGIDVELRPAGPVVRGLAFVTDQTIATLGTMLISGFLTVLGEAGTGVYLVVLFLVEWFYPVLFEVLRGGQTPGKKMMGLRVVYADATPIGWNASLLRNLLLFADMVPGFYLTGIVSMCLTRRFQRLGDLAANTLVVHVGSEAGAFDRSIASSRDAISALGAMPTPVALTSNEQRSFLGFAERQGELSAERAVELAEVLAPISGASGEEGRLAVLRIANGIAGDV